MSARACIMYIYKCIIINCIASRNLWARLNNYYCLQFENWFLSIAIRSRFHVSLSTEGWTKCVNGGGGSDPHEMFLNHVSYLDKLYKYNIDVIYSKNNVVILIVTHTIQAHIVPIYEFDIVQQLLYFYIIIH